MNLEQDIISNVQKDIIDNQTDKNASTLLHITLQNCTKQQRRRNPWCDFVKENSKNIDKTYAKDRFAILSEMWKNKKASMVSVSSEYLNDIMQTQYTLKSKLDEAERTIVLLQERLQYFESNYINNECDTELLAEFEK